MNLGLRALLAWIALSGPLYSEGFEVSHLPKEVMEKYLCGKAFDNPCPYTQEEQSLLLEDIEKIYARIIESDPTREKVAILTAGAPGAGKTTLIHQELEKERFAYICPDDVCLKQQEKTYIAELKKGDPRTAYQKWRPGSNAAAHIILARLIQGGYGFYFGTTLTHPEVDVFLQFLKERGYEIRLLHITAPDEVRWQSIQKREKAFLQVTEKDVKEKGAALPQRLLDYLTYADRIDFYYRARVDEGPSLAARWTPTSMDILSLVSYEEIKRVHNTAIQALKKPELAWEQVHSHPKK